MAKMTYSEQLRHPNWQRKRLEVMQKANFACETCGDKETTLNVHHRRYVKGRMAWEYLDSELSVLCEPCHAIYHDERVLLDRLLIENNNPDVQQLIVGIAAGYLFGSLDIEQELAMQCHDGREAYFEYGLAISHMGYEEARNFVRAKTEGGKGTPVARWFVDYWDAHKK